MSFSRVEVSRTQFSLSVLLLTFYAVKNLSLMLLRKKKESLYWSTDESGTIHSESRVDEKNLGN